jgi:hypothetical protein
MSQNPLAPVNIDKGTLLNVVAGSGANSPFVSQDITNPFGSGGVFGINISALNGTVTFHIKGKDQSSGTYTGTYYDILVSAAQSSTGFITLTVIPGGPVVANVSSNLPLPRTFQVTAVLSGAGNTVSFTIGASLIV